MPSVFDNLSQEEIDKLRGLNLKDKDKVKYLQSILGVDVDGVFGKKSAKALQSEINNYNDEDNQIVVDGKFGKKSKSAWNQMLSDEDKALKAHNVAKSKNPVEYTNAFYDIEDVEEPIYTRTYDYPEIALLDKQISEVKKQLADRQAKYESVPQPKTQVGWGSYIANNDATLLNKYQDAERAWYNKLIDQAHAKELAKAQMEQQSGFDKEARIKDFNNAKVAADTAYQLLRNDNSNDKNVRAKLINDYKSAINNLNYYARKTGNEEYELDEDLLNKAIDEQTTAVKNVDYGSIKSFDTQAQKDATLKEIEANPAFKTDEKLREIYNTLSKIKPKDKQASDKAARRAKWIEGKKLKGVDYKIWKRSPEGQQLIKEFGE